MAKICSSWKYQVVLEETIGMLLIVQYPAGSKQVGSIRFTKPEARIKEDTKSWKPRKAEKLSELQRVMERVSVNAVGYPRHPDEDVKTMLQLSSLFQPSKGVNGTEEELVYAGGDWIHASHYPRWGRAYGTKVVAQY